MLTTLVIIYLGGCVLTAALFAVMLIVLNSHKTEDSRYLFRMFAGIMPKYVFLWPWEFGRLLVLMPHIRRDA